MRLSRILAALLVCVSMVGCGFRALTEQDVPGTYKASADWGSSTLVLHPDHSFDQTVVRNDHTQTSIKGTWQLSFVAGKKKASSGVLSLKPFLAVEHDHKGDPAPLDLPSISRGFLWGMTISADPDYGISFDKK
jgi:hypothetical protein